MQTDDQGSAVSNDVMQPYGPRICETAFKDEFATLDGVDSAKSKIAFDATSGVIKAPQGLAGELYNKVLQCQNDANVLKLDWVGSGVTFYVSADGSTWTQLANGQPLKLTTASRSLTLKAVLAANTGSLDRYTLQINPTGFNLFTGKMLTQETGLVYFGGRWYDPETGRWINPDPAEQGEDWYLYCYDDPINMIDPDGKWASGAHPACGYGHQDITRKAARQSKIYFKLNQETRYEGKNMTYLDVLLIENDRSDRVDDDFRYGMHHNDENVNNIKSFFPKRPELHGNQTNLVNRDIELCPEMNSIVLSLMNMYSYLKKRTVVNEIGSDSRVLYAQQFLDEAISSWIKYGGQGKYYENVRISRITYCSFMWVHYEIAVILGKDQ